MDLGMHRALVVVNLLLVDKASDIAPPNNDWDVHSARPNILQILLISVFAILFGHFPRLLLYL
jgi:hypothetical protein